MSALAGPLRPVRYADGATEWHDLPRNTLDIRYAACGNHHLACDCREAMLAEEIAEYRAMFRETEHAILAAIKGHLTWAYTPDGYEDEMARCKCPACVIARAAHIGYVECMNARTVDTLRLQAEARRRDRHYYDLNEVPF